MYLSIFHHSYRNIRGFYANSVDPDHTLRSAASDLGLRCLLVSFDWDDRH